MSSEGIIEAVKKSKAEGFFFGKLGSGWEGGQREKGQQELTGILQKQRSRDAVEKRVRAEHGGGRL